MPRTTLLGIQIDRLIAALAIAVSASFLLCGYECIRSVSQSLYIGAYTSARLPIVMALGPIGTLMLIYGYGHLLSALGAQRAVILTSLLSAAAVLGCYAAIRDGSRIATAVLYVFREAYIVLLVEQVWAFINSALCSGEGRKLNGPICGIASLGSIAGGFLVRGLAVKLGSANLLLVGAATLIPTGLCAALAYHVGGEPQPAPAEANGRQGHLGVRTLFRSPLLRNLALLVATTQIVSTVLDLQLSRYVEIAISATDARTRWFGSFYLILNFGSAFFQFIGAPLLLHWMRLRWIHVGVPAVHLVFCAAAVFFPSLMAAAAALLVFKVLDYSVFRAAKELLYVPLSFDARYRAKELIDAFGYRLAKGAASAALAVAGSIGTVPMVGLPIAAIAALLGWLPLAVRITAHAPSIPAPKAPLS